MVRRKLTSVRSGAAETLAEVVRKAASARNRVLTLINMAIEYVRVKKSVGGVGK
jgi:hypothetical protein